MTSLCKLNEKCVCSKCCAVVFPFFSEGDFEYKALIFNYCDINNVNITYDEYVSPTKLSELKATLQKDDLYLIHFNVRSLSRNLNKVEEFHATRCNYHIGKKKKILIVPQMSVSLTTILYIMIYLLVLEVLVFTLKTHFSFICEIIYLSIYYSCASAAKLCLF